MASVHKRATDRERGKAGKWTAYFADEHGKQRSKVAFTDKQKSLDYANEMERQCRLVKDGLIDPAEKARREQERRPAVDHVLDYVASLEAKGDTAKHTLEVYTVLVGFVARAIGTAPASELDAPTVQRGLAALRETLSARTCNKARGFVRAFLVWLAEANRIREVPRGLRSIPRFNEAADRRLVRRALTMAEVDWLLAVTGGGPRYELARGPAKGPRKQTWISGAERACLYRLAMGTGFRASEIRTLTPERFQLDGDEPTITALACYTKNGKEAVQPITKALAAGLKPFIDGRPPGKPVVPIPTETAKMLKRDLAAAGIPYRTDKGTVDFHALRGTYITHLVASGANLKVVQTLARHSTIVLTIDRYAKADDGDLRKALDGGKTG